MKHENNRMRQDVLDLVSRFNDTARHFPDRTTIQELFEAQVEQHPSELAVICDHPRVSGSPPFLTYGQLNERVNQLANLLLSRGAGPEQVIGIAVERSFAMIIGLLGILKAGGAYMPISPDNPIERIQYMLADSGARMLLVQSEGLKLPRFDGQVIDLESPEILSGERTNPPGISKPRDLAYVIYTSGSTGRPKGVMIEHRSVINRLTWMQRSYPLTKDDVILQKTPFYFDVSVWELFWWVLNGAKMCLLRPGGEKNPFSIIETVEKHRITVMHFVPSMLNVFLEYLSGKGPAEAARLDSLRRVFASGEALTPSHVRRFNKVFERSSMRLTNLYGPTEATVDVTYFDCPRDDDFEKIPIGRPIDNTKIIILRDGELCGIGESGELCISGIGVGRGYINNPAMTAAKFVMNPFFSGERIYKTGDIARWLPDGNIEYLGRDDDQVKIRGLRIELGEIESNMRDFPGINDCVVICKKYSESVILIIAYFVAKGGIVVDELRKYLQAHLPDYMVPNQFIEIAKIPLSPNGKADRQALPDPRLSARK